MKQHLSSLLQLLEQSPKLSDPEKRAASLLIEEVKKELLSKEEALRIEAALEKVRAVALIMKQREDMQKVCMIISGQLAALGVNEIRNVQTAIFHPERSTYSNYEYYPKHNKTVFTETDYKNHRIHQEFAEHMLKGAGEVYIHTIRKEELADWIAYQKTTNVFIDSFLETASSLSYYWYSLGPVALGISTYAELTETEIELFRRFKNVFELSYRRYLDIEKAEAQAREAQIETGLERVRSRAMAMENSDELSTLIGTLFTELTRLDLALTRSVILFFDAQTKEAKGWMANMEKPDLPFTYHVKYPDLPFYNAYLEGWSKRDVKWQYVLEGKNKVATDDYLFSKTELSTLPPQVIAGMRQPEKVVLSASFNNFGCLTLSSLEHLPSEHFDILIRFAKVFDLTYTRFNDLKHAEALAKEAQLEGEKLKEEKKRSDALLLNILPEDIANELKQFGKSYARKHDEVTILFADIKGFSTIAEKLSAQELVTQLDECFRAFDHIVDKHGLEKIKTVGDAYVCASGLPNPLADHATKAVRAAIDMQNFIRGFSLTRTIQDLPAFDFRIGINTGTVVTGVVGVKKFTYDIWGDAVNMAARMEQHGEAGKINISGSTYQLVKDQFTCKYRGKITAKNKGEVDMYFVEDGDV